jgi:hypothetical protein
LLEYKVEAKAIGSDGKMEKVALVRDISLGGLRIESEQPIKEGDIMIFEIAIPGSSRFLLAHAEVVWTNGKIGGLLYF